MKRRRLILLAAAALLAACHPAAQAQSDAQAAKAAQSYMASNAKQPGVITLPSGLQYKIVRSGPSDGPHPHAGDEVKVNYEGAFTDGRVFDSSYQRGEPADMPLADLIPAWMQALPMMRPGDEWMLYVPPALGYGAEDKGPIPANSVLVFKIELLGVLPHPALG
jgi:FKBP-type peptidyl-prolyl cis-trans isomerase